jgi:hypothetical protein
VGALRCLYILDSNYYYLVVAEVNVVAPGPLRNESLVSGMQRRPSHILHTTLRQMGYSLASIACLELVSVRSEAHLMQVSCSRRCLLPTFERALLQIRLSEGALQSIIRLRPFPQSQLSLHNRDGLHIVSRQCIVRRHHCVLPSNMFGRLHTLLHALSSPRFYHPSRPKAGTISWELS